MSDVIPISPVLELAGLGKRFPGVVALDAVSLALRPGEVHGLIGQNGAGKSTLINILSGMYAADAGSIAMGGQPLVLAGPRHALALGIATVYQELSLLPNLSIAETGARPRAAPLRLFDRAAARRRPSPRWPRSVWRSRRTRRSAASPSPTSRWSRSPRRSPSRRAC